VPVLLIEQLNVATPLEALTGLVPHVKVPALGLVPMARVTGADDEVTTLPKASSTDTPVVKFVPAAVLVGWVVTASLVGVPATIENPDEVPDVKPLRAALNVYVPAAAVPLIVQLAKVATPPTALTVLLVQLRAPWVLPLLAVE